MTPMRILLLLLPLLLFTLPLHAEEEKREKAIYHPLEPAFVVNVEEGQRKRFMQIKVQLMTRDKSLIDKIDAHLPPLRHAMIMLLAHQSTETMRSTQGREEVRQQALLEVQRVMREVAGVKKGIEGLYFTDFVIQ
ncbi:MAG: flagellar basal body-associated FliL family protein [Pseudomonadota bacterium]